MAGAINVGDPRYPGRFDMKAPKMARARTVPADTATGTGNCPRRINAVNALTLGSLGGVKGALEGLLAREPLSGVNQVGSGADRVPHRSVEAAMTPADSRFTALSPMTRRGLPRQ